MSIVLVAIAARVWMALTTRTFFQPDEFFQSLEVAHRIVFGYGKLTWEWQPATAIRSIVFPALYVPVYWILRVAGLDGTVLLIYAPKLLNGLFASLTDIWICELTRRVLGERYVSTVFFVSLTSFFHGISLTRSMSNSLETSLTVIALSYYPWDSFNIQRIRKSLFLAALTCAIRPTAAVLWVYMYGLLLWRLRSNFRLLTTLIWNTILLGIGFTGALVLLDSTFYGRLTFTPLNFLITNLSSISLAYGSSPWHYYITQGVPVLCTTTLPFVIHGAYTSVFRGISSCRTLLVLVIWTIGVYSLTGHKEWRFIHPLLPILHIFASKSLVDSQHPQQQQSTPPKSILQIRSYRLAALLLPLIPIAYLTLFHSEAQISVMHYLRGIPAEEIRSLGFLMPCHSTPWQAYLHKPELEDPGLMWALGCEPPPPPPISERDGYYRDQTDVFYASPPVMYLRERFPPVVDRSFPRSPSPITIQGGPPSVDWKHEWPKYLVMFGTLLEDTSVRELLIDDLGYIEVWRSGNGLEEDWRRRGGVRVLRISQ